MPNSGHRLSFHAVIVPCHRIWGPEAIAAQSRGVPQTWGSARFQAATFIIGFAFKW
jgi:hypothetical protein